MNFEVGDIVIDLGGMSLWDNIYYADKTINRMRKQVVTDANNKVFTTLPDFKVGPDHAGYGFADWDVQSKIFHQANGRRWDCTDWEAMANLTKNRAGIEAYLKREYDKANDKANDEDAVEIRRLEAVIASAQAQIDKVKAGKRVVSYNTDFVVHEFLNDRYAKLLKALD